MTAARRPRLAVAALVLAAAAVRAWDLDHMSIWQDEGLSLYRAGLGWRDILAGGIPLDALMTRDVQPPLYFVKLAAWFALVGVSTWSGKTLSLLMALPAVPLTWALGRRWLGPRAALAAAAFTALSPAYLWYTQEVRHYTMVVTLGLIGVYAAVRAWDIDGATTRRASPSPGDPFSPRAWAVVAVVANAALVWTHYLGFFLVLFQGIAVLAAVARRRGPRGWLALAPLAAVALLALPLVPYAVWRLGIGPERDQHFVPLTVMLKDIVLGFSFGKSADQASPWVMALDAGFAALLAAGLAGAWRARRPAALFLGGYLVVPVLALYAVTFVKPVYMGFRHILVVAPAYYLLLGAGIAALARRRRPAAWAAAALALGAMLAADLAFYRDPRFRKDDYRALAEYVRARAVPGDAVLVPNGVLKLTFDHLAPDLPVVSLPPFLASGLQDARPAEDQLMPLFRQHPRLWYVDPPRAPVDMAGWLDARALRVDRQDFPGDTTPVYFNAYELAPVLRGGQNPPRRETVHLGPLDLLGWDVRPAELVPGRAGRVRLIWQVTARGIPAYKVSLVVRDAAGRDHADGDHEPYHGQHPTSAWTFGELTYEPHDLLVDPTAPPGTYTLGITVYDPATGETYPSHGPAPLGEVTVARPPVPVAPRAVAIPARLSAIGPGLTVLGASLPTAPGGPWTVGTRLWADVWVRVDDPARVPARLAVDLLDAFGRTAATAATDLDADGLGADARPGDLRRVRVPLGLPGDAGRYDIRARLVDPDGGTRWLRRGRPAVWPVRGLWLGRVAVTAPPMREETPQMDVALGGVPVGDAVALMGYDLGVTQPRPGDDLPVTLYWRVTAPLGADYRATVQLVPAPASDADAPAGPPVAQHDGIPAGGTRPTAGWRAGEVVADPHTLAVPADTPPGDYLLIAALYDPASSGPRPVARQDGRERDFVLLRRIAVAARPAPATP